MHSVFLLIIDLYILFCCIIVKMPEMAHDCGIKLFYSIQGLIQQNKTKRITLQMPKISRSFDHDYRLYYTPFSGTMSPPGKQSGSSDTDAISLLCNITLESTVIW